MSKLPLRIPADFIQAFINARIWDGTNSPPFQGELVTKGNTIIAVNSDPEKFGKFDSTPNTIIDCRGMTLMPGLIEGHSHPSFPDSYDFDIPPEEHTLITMYGVQKLLDAGYTSISSAASAKIRLDVVIRNEINAGRIVGPRMRAAGPEITCPGGLGDGIVKGLHESNCFGYPVANVEEMQRVVHLIIDQGVDIVKLNISGEDWNQNETDITSLLGDEEVSAAVKIAHERKVKVAAHCRGSESVLRAIKNNVDFIFHCDFADEEGIALLVKHQSRVILGPAIGYLDRTNQQKKLAAQRQTYKKLKELAPDMRIVIGGDYGFPETLQGTNAHDLGCLVKHYDYTPIEALICGTNMGGHIMELPVGQLKANYFADMLLIDGDPTHDVTLLTDKNKIKLIVLDGWLYKNTL